MSLMTLPTTDSSATTWPSARTGPGKRSGAFASAAGPRPPPLAGSTVGAPGPGRRQARSSARAPAPRRVLHIAEGGPPASAVRARRARRVPRRVRQMRPPDAGCGAALRCLCLGGLGGGRREAAAEAAPTARKAGAEAPRLPHSTRAVDAADAQHPSTSRAVVDGARGCSGRGGMAALRRGVCLAGGA
eukprot:CAMPEP_0204598956 /NCGR_PEP_ID=MMETSP0661-20131031/54574_1 /ASSEMBLY_ACC=CAM_ASM_000606 /TAXON_ID=109239 /ORGANISM="Alexandrium margalefi, Strain AMGDE01CS-322" /LENGTH=187 /DNA_ID=CAMNT_0051609665 /DNA_START=92 /DNA_END=651 /DNA_ORIENTATION=-